jgi:hypothetical protein
MTNANTKQFIIKAADAINDVLTCYYDEAPATAAFPYCVLSGINVQDLADGDQIFFDVDIWTDEKQQNATGILEGYCDTIRNALSGLPLSVENTFHCHINFDSQQTVRDNEHDIAHRRLSFTSRIFYY